MYRGLRPNVMDICAARRREAHIDCLLVLEQSQESGLTFVGPLFLRRASCRLGPLIPYGFAPRSGEMGGEVNKQEMRSVMWGLTPSTAATGFLLRRVLCLQWRFEALRMGARTSQSAYCGLEKPAHGVL
jgi:hypothetical protein